MSRRIINAEPNEFCTVLMLATENLFRQNKNRYSLVFFEISFSYLLVVDFEFCHCFYRACDCVITVKRIILTTSRNNTNKTRGIENALMLMIQILLQRFKSFSLFLSSVSYSYNTTC